ncbi:hypothetical protein Y032_0113g360 [Ancylostoma ceylanicum]|nr:hypothetical protein Y032_0113g360 [Ancylostoma ceylanicum]
MMKAGLVLFIMLVIFAVLEAKVGVVENADKCRVAHNFRQVFDDGHNKLRMEMGLPEMIYDCEFEQAAAKEEEQPGYAEKNNYGKLTFTRTWETSVVEELIRAFQEMRKDGEAVRVAGIDDRKTTIPYRPDPYEDRQCFPNKDLPRNDFY